MKEEVKEDTNGVKEKDDLDVGWESTRRMMTDLEKKVKIFRERMNKLLETYSNPVVVESKCITNDMEESKVEMKEQPINQDISYVTLAHADDMTISAHKLILADSKLQITDVTLVCEDETIFAHKIVFQCKNALLYKEVSVQLESQNRKSKLSKPTSSSDMEPDRKSEFLLFQSGEGSLYRSEEFLQRPPPSPPYYFPPSPPHYEGSPGHQDYGQNYGGLVQDTQCYYERGGQHYK